MMLGWPVLAAKFVDLTRRDLAVGFGSLAVGLFLFALGAYQRSEQHTWMIVTIVLASVAAALTRSRQMTGVVLGASAFGVDQIVGPSLGPALIFTQVLYDACCYGSSAMERFLLWLTSGVTVGITIVLAIVTRQVEAAMSGVILGLVLVLPAWSGSTMRRHRAAAALERERAEQAILLTELGHRRAVAAERTLMARELHDVVANHLSIIAIHATGALALSSEKHEQARHAMGVVRENAVRGLSELREAIRLLRMENPGDVTSGCGIADVPALVERLGRSGLRVRTETRGTLPKLPMPVDLAAYRIIQESLMNAIKYGDGAAGVLIEYAPPELLLTITNPVTAEQVRQPPGVGSGAGIIGMRERVSLLQGTLEASRAGSEFRVTVRLPVEEVP